MSLGELGLALKDAADDKAKWEIIYKDIASASPTIKEQPDLSVESQLAVHIASAHVVSDILLKYYPEIRYRLTFEMPHLQELAYQRGHQGHPMWDELHGDMRVYRTIHHKDTGEVARQWLLLLTGRDFKTTKEAESWLSRNEENLRWDPNQGCFVVSGGVVEGD